MTGTPVAPGLEPYVSAAGPTGRRPGRGRLVAGVAAVVVLLLVAAAAAWFFLLRDSSSPVATANEAAYQASFDVLASMHDATSLAEIASLAAPAGPAAAAAGAALAQSPGDSSDHVAFAAQQALLTQVAALTDLPESDLAGWPDRSTALSAALRAAAPPDDTLFLESGGFSVRLIDRLVAAGQPTAQVG